jgi:pimeloyl-ACP methyl ester carboxylesterase
MSTLRPIARNTRPSNALVVAGIAAAALGATAGWVRQRARAAERAYPPRGAFIDIDGVRLHYLAGGTGEPVVLLHGNVVHAMDFVASGLFDRLARTNRVIAFDRPGFGHSQRPRGRRWTAAAQAELLHRALAGLDIDSAVVLGHSWGTLVALELALRASAMVRKLVLVSGYYFPTARLDVALATPAAIPVVGAVLRYTVAPVVARMTFNKTIEKMFAPEPVPWNFLPTVSRELLVRPSQIRANAQDAAFMIPATIALRARYAELKLPTTIIAGQADQVVDVDVHSRALHGQLANSELRALPGVGHMAHYSGLDDITRAVTFESRPVVEAISVRG